MRTGGKSQEGTTSAPGFESGRQDWRTVLILSGDMLTNVYFLPLGSLPSFALKNSTWPKVILRILYSSSVGGFGSSGRGNSFLYSSGKRAWKDLQTSKWRSIESLR